MIQKTKHNFFIKLIYYKLPIITHIHRFLYLKAKKNEKKQRVFGNHLQLQHQKLEFVALAQLKYVFIVITDTLVSQSYISILNKKK